MNITDIKGTTKLSNGIEMPYFGLGVFKAENGREVVSAVEHALEFGYRHIDTAAVYKNEEGVGEGIRNVGLAREEIFVTSKVWNSVLREGDVIEACEKSLERLGLDYLDLYLIHWPVKEKFVDAWSKMEKLLDLGLVKAIGVSNFLKHHLEELLAACRISPMVNQVEFHPHLQQRELREFCNSREIQYEGWAPLMRGEVFELEKLVDIGEKHGKNAGQVVLRWHLQNAVIAIPKSVNNDRIRSNAEIFDFELSDQEMAAIDSLDQNRRTGPHPDTFEF